MNRLTGGDLLVQVRRVIWRTRVTMISLHLGYILVNPGA